MEILSGKPVVQMFGQLPWIHVVNKAGMNIFPVFWHNPPPNLSHTGNRILESVFGRSNPSRYDAAFIGTTSCSK